MFQPVRQMQFTPSTLLLITSFVSALPQLGAIERVAEELPAYSRLDPLKPVEKLVKARRSKAVVALPLAAVGFTGLVAEADHLQRKTAHKFPVTAITFSLDSSLISGDDSGLIIVWDLNQRRPKKTWQAHTTTVLSLSSYNDMVISQGRDNSIRIWRDDVEIDILPCESLHFAQFKTFEEKLVFCIPNPARICVYSLSDKSFWFIPLDVKKGACTALACNNSGIWAGFEDGGCILYSFSPSNAPVQGLQAHTEPILNLSILDLECISSSADNKIHNQSTPAIPIVLPSAGVSCMLGLSRTNLVLVGWDGVIRLFKEQKSAFEVIEHRKSIRCVGSGSASLRGNFATLIAFGSEDMRISVWGLIAT